jgi:hypothetical protein
MLARDYYLSQGAAGQAQPPPPPPHSSTGLREAAA